MKLKVISGGQTGADQAALRAARAAGIETGGTAAKRWRVEDGFATWLADFGLKECSHTGYVPRTKANVADATACLWLGNPHSPGGKLTLGECVRRNLDHYVVVEGVTYPRDVVNWLTGIVFPGESSVTLLVAGNRESSAPGIGERAERFLGVVFRLLKAEVQDWPH